MICLQRVCLCFILYYSHRNCKRKLHKGHLHWITLVYENANVLMLDLLSEEPTLLPHWPTYWLLITRTHSSVITGRLLRFASLLSSLALSLSPACSKPRPASLYCAIPGIPLCLPLHCLFWVDFLLVISLSHCLFGGSHCALACALRIVCSVWFIHQGQPHDGSAAPPASAHCV